MTFKTLNKKKTDHKLSKMYIKKKKHSKQFMKNRENIFIYKQ